MGRILAICTSSAKGTPKSCVSVAKCIENFGIEDDAHAGNWHRQISFLAFEKIDEFRKKGAEVDFGAFGENFVVEGIDFSKVSIGTRLKSEDIIFEITQLGKECHSRCKIYEKMGDCIMPRDGIFAKVLQGGEVREGQEISFIE